MALSLGRGMMAFPSPARLEETWGDAQFIAEVDMGRE